MSTVLNVPFKEKDEAKRLGARWDGDQTKWVVPKGKDLAPFEKWLPQKPPENDKGATTLSLLIAGVSKVIRNNFLKPTWCVCEIAELNDRSGHGYFDLVEHDKQGNEVAKIRANCWQAELAQLNAKFIEATGSPLSAGMKVMMAVTPSMHDRFGLSLNITDIDPNYTLGDMERKLQDIISTLDKEGNLTKNKQTELPHDFTRVAVLSPEGAAGLGDFKREADALMHFGVCDFEYYHARFQGDYSEKEICTQFDKLLNDHDKTPFDAIVIIRGGGAVTDLAWLNSLEIARRVCLAPVAVLTGIGHERDNTVLDLVAAHRCDTPSKVSHYIASVVVHNAMQAFQAYTDMTVHADNLLTQTESSIVMRMDGISRSAKALVESVESNLTHQVAQMKSNALNTVELMTMDLRSKLAQVTGFEPRQVLQQGYAIVRADGQHVSSAKKITKKSHVSVEFHDGVKEIN